MTKMKALSLALVGIFLSTAYVAAAEGDSSPAPATASADPSAPGSVADPAGSPVESSVRTLTEQEDALIEQISQLDRSDPDYQNQLKAIGAELRRIQEELQWSNHSFGVLTGIPPDRGGRFRRRAVLSLRWDGRCLAPSIA